MQSTRPIPRPASPATPEPVGSGRTLRGGAWARWARQVVPLVLGTAVLFQVSCDALTDNGNDDVAGLIGSQFIPITLTGASVSEGLIAGQTTLRAESFLTNLRAKLGHDPTRVDLVRIGVERPEASTGAGIASWAEAFSDKVEIQILPEGSGIPILVGEGTRPATGVAAWAPRVLIPRGGFDNYPAVAEGRFTVRISGTTAKSATDTFSFPVRVELEFIAF